MPAACTIRTTTAVGRRCRRITLGPCRAPATTRTSPIGWVGSRSVDRLPGDANLDGKVDINDLTIVLANYNQTGETWSQGDFNGDGKVDVNDLTIALANHNQTFGAGSPATNGPLSVPEPPAIVLLAGVLAAMAWSALRPRRLCFSITECR